MTHTHIELTKSEFIYKSRYRFDPLTRDHNAPRNGLPTDTLTPDFRERRIPREVVELIHSYYPEICVMDLFAILNIAGILKITLVTNYMCPYYSRLAIDITDGERTVTVFETSERTRWFVNGNQHTDWLVGYDDVCSFDNANAAFMIFETQRAGSYRRYKTLTPAFEWYSL